MLKMIVILKLNLTNYCFDDSVQHLHEREVIW